MTKNLGFLKNTIAATTRTGREYSRLAPSKLTLDWLGPTLYTKTLFELVCEVFVYEPNRRPGSRAELSAARHRRATTAGTVACLLGTVAVVWAFVHLGPSAQPVRAVVKPTPAPTPVAHGTVYLLGCDGKRVELSKYAGAPEVQTATTLGTVSRWRDGSGQTLMTRAAVLFVQAKK